MRFLRLALTLLFPLTAAAQEMVKVNFVGLYDKVPPPPASAREAYARCEHAPDHYEVVTAAKFYEPWKTKTDQYNRQLEEVGKKLQQPMTDKMKSVDPDEVQKKMATMTQAEKIAYAMELNKKMGLSGRTMVMEPPPVLAALEEFQNVTASIAGDMQTAGHEHAAQAKLQEEHKKKHEEIETWTRAEEAKLPRVSGGEMDWPEPKAFHALMLKSADKLVALDNEYLAAAARRYRDELAKAKKRFSTLQQKLAAISYGQDAKNAESKTTCNSAEGMTLGPVGALVGLSLEATEHAARSWGRKLRVENEKP